MSHSTKRRRTKLMQAWFDPDEAAAVLENAKAHGGVSAFLRNIALGHHPPASKIDQQAVTQLMGRIAALKGAVNKAGSNFNQFAREANRGREPQTDAFAAQWEEFKALFDADMAELRLACLQALGRERDRKPPAKH